MDDNAASISTAVDVACIITCSTEMDVSAGTVGPCERLGIIVGSNDGCILGRIVTGANDGTVVDGATVGNRDGSIVEEMVGATVVMA